MIDKNTIKFKQQNIQKLTDKLSCNYYMLDILRQTSINRFVDFANKNGITAEQLKAYILKNTKFLLDLMIKENKGGKNEKIN